MRTTFFLDALSRDGEAFAAACAAADPGTPIAACPDWTIPDLWWHMTEVLHFWHTIVGQQLQDWSSYEQPARPPDAQLASVYRAGLAATVAVLGAADPLAPVWTWSSDHTVGFVIRRIAQEMAVHCWDAQRVAGDARPIEAELASDGIDEFLAHFINDPRPGAVLDGSVHIHCTDVAGEWTTRPTAGTLITVAEHAKGDCAIRGAASDVLLALWRRQELSLVDVVGEAQVAAQFIGYAALG